MTLPIVFRTADPMKWGAGSAEDLAAEVIDNNMWLLKSAVEQMQADMPDVAVGIDTFTVTNDQFTVVLTDGSTRGPYTLPTTVWTFQGDWQALAAYSINDVVVNGYALYLVIYSHTSAATFDPDANDGNGHNYYQKLFDFEEFATPIGGTTGQVLQKNSDTDRDFIWYTIPDPIAPPGDNTLVYDYLSTELMVDGDLATNPTSVFPAFTLNDTTWSVGELSFTYNGNNNPRVLVPVGDLEVGSWYLFTYEGEILYDMNLITAEKAHLTPTLGGSGSIVFQAADTSDVFTFDFYNYVIGAVRTLTSFSCRKITQPTLITLKNGDSKFMEVRIGDGNIFVGERSGDKVPISTVSVYGPANNIAIGVGSMEEVTEQTYENIAIGTGALKHSEGSDQIAIGHMALTKCTNGNNTNIAIGNRAMSESDYAVANVIIGHGIRYINGNENIVVGTSLTFSKNRDGDANVIIGPGALANAQDSNQNVIIGYSAAVYGGSGAQTFNFNTFIGSQADSVNSGVINSIAIGHSAKVPDNNTVQLGNSSVKKAYVGTKAIGLPQHKLVAGAIAGDVSVTGIMDGDRLDEVIYFPGAGGVEDLTSEFTISADNTINNNAGTNSTGGKLLVRWTSLT